MAALATAKTVSAMYDIPQRLRIPVGELELQVTPNPDAYAGSVYAALKVMLKRPSNATLIPASAKHTLKITIEDQLISVRGRDGQAFQPQMNQKGTTVMKWTEMYRVFGKGTPSRHPNDISANVLNMQNNSGRGLVQTEIREVDLSQLINRKEDNSSAEPFVRGATSTTSTITIDSGWMFISKGWGVSS
jgi:hypothetical protein